MMPRGSFTVYFIAGSEDFDYAALEAALQQLTAPAHIKVVVGRQVVFNKGVATFDYGNFAATLEELSTPATVKIVTCRNRRCREH